MLQSKRRTKCIVCGGKLSDDLVFIGDQYPSAVYPEVGSDYKQSMKASSLNLTKCLHRECGLVQLRHEYNLDFVYKNYPYLSGGTATMKKILSDVVNEVEGVVSLNSNDIVLDIGGNDGTLLSLLSKPVKKRINIDAASGITSVLNDPNYIRVEDKFSAKAYLNLKQPAPKVIFCVAMFYQLDDSLTFCRDIRKIMDDETILCIQMTYLGSMLESNIYDNIVHEHVAYYSLGSLEYLLNKVGLQILDAKIVESYGGSLRVIVRKAKKKPVLCTSKGAKAIREYERTMDVNTTEGLKRFNERTILLRDFTRQLIDHIVAKHGKILALGASTKGNMICQFLGLTSQQIACALDNSDKKIGLVMTGSDIPIADEKEYLGKLTEYLLVLPYYYTDFFKSLIQKYLQPNHTVYLLVPLPKPYFIKVSNEQINLLKEYEYAKVLHRSNH